MRTADITYKVVWKAHRDTHCGTAVELENANLVGDLETSSHPGFCEIAV